MRIPGTRNNASQPISQLTLFWLAALVLLAELPHYMNLPWWVSLFGALVVVGKCATCLRSNSSISHWFLSSYLLAFLALLAAVAVRLHYGYFLGRDPCVAFLFLLISFKFAESKTNKDVTLVTCLSAFLLLTQYFYSQTILSALITLPAVLALGGVLIVVRDDSVKYPVARNLKITSKLLLHGAPIAAVLFLLFPRLPGPLWDLPHDSAGQTGLSETMQPGTISSLSLSSEVAFRVEFDTAPPSQSDRYWRGPVLSVFNGRAWGINPRTRHASPISDENEPTVNYTVTLEPHNHRWLFALDIANNGDQNPSRHINTRLAGRNPRAVAFAQELRNESKNPEEFANKLMSWFNQQAFTYTLQPKLLGDSPVDEFLFDTRGGFCEHYASAMAVLLRAVSIPARIVTGYQGGEMNGDYMIVRQSDAHAWVEAWINGVWRRYDPTAAVAPERVETGFAASLDASEPVPLLARGRDHWLNRLQLRLDAINYNWKRFVVDFDNKSQISFWQSLGISSPKPLHVVLVILTSCAIWCWFTLRSSVGSKLRENDETKLWRQYCKKMAKAGLPRNRHEGPMDYHMRCVETWPDQAPNLNLIANNLMQLRYGEPNEKDRMLLLQIARRALSRLPKLKTLGD